MKPSSSSGGGGAIYRNNEADSDTKIADLSHAKTITFNIGESDIFRRVITLERTVGPDYCTPNCNMIGGELLYINRKSYQTTTTKNMMAEVDIFGLVFLGDLDMTKGRPIINIIASSSNVPVAVLGVKYFSKHLAQGGKKDDTCTLEELKPHLEKYNEKNIRTDLVLFDGASNLHKSGKILAASYPRITVLHSAKKVLYLFSPTLQHSQLSG